MENNKKLKFAKNAFEMLKTDPSSAAFAEETLDKKLLLKLKKSKYKDDKFFFKVVNSLLLNNETVFEPENVNRTNYVEEREIDNSTLYSFIVPFQLLHVDIGNLEFLGENVPVPQYDLVIVDLFSSKVYTYPMKSRKQIRQNLSSFIEMLKAKEKVKK